MNIPKPHPYVGVVLIAVNYFPAIVSESANGLIVVTEVVDEIKEIIQGTDVRVEKNVQSEFMTDRVEEIGRDKFVMQNPNSLTENEQENVFTKIATTEAALHLVDRLVEQAQPYMDSQDPENVLYQRDMQDVKVQLPMSKEDYIEALRNRPEYNLYDLNESTNNESASESESDDLNDSNNNESASESESDDS
jgi:hypothetical protein